MLCAVSLVFALLVSDSSAACPCEKEELCQPVQHEHEFEVFVFDVGGDKWKYYDWSHVTTVAAFGKYNPELMCYAHSRGARLVLKGDVPLSDVLDAAERTAWITEKVHLAKSQFMDGINLDIEQAVETYSPEYYALTALVKETTETFHREIPGSQVSFDVPWAPWCIAKRCYDYKAIADSCDLFFVMSYDEQSQIWGNCIAMANAPLNQTLAAYDEYMKMGIDNKKLVMGVPWYGYDYPCLNLSQEGSCTILKVSFRGAPCSDASAIPMPYSTIMKQIKSSMSGRLWDELQQAPYYNYKDGKGNIHQVWYDDPESISLKAAYAGQRRLRGIGMWNGNLLDYRNDTVAQQQSAEMWNALIPKKMYIFDNLL